jgi:GNAT superfamily N-acetyltransferase
MSVHAQFRRRGLGTALLSSAVRQSPAINRLICLHGHEAIRGMARRMGWRCEKAQDAGLALCVEKTKPPSAQQGRMGFTPPSWAGAAHDL